MVNEEKPKKSTTTRRHVIHRNSGGGGGGGGGNDSSSSSSRQYTLGRLLSRFGFLCWVSYLTIALVLLHGLNQSFSSHSEESSSQYGFLQGSSSSSSNNPRARYRYVQQQGHPTMTRKSVSFFDMAKNAMVLHPKQPKPEHKPMPRVFNVWPIPNFMDCHIDRHVHVRDMLLDNDASSFGSSSSAAAAAWVEDLKEVFQSSVMEGTFIRDMHFQSSASSLAFLVEEPVIHKSLPVARVQIHVDQYEHDLLKASEEYKIVFSEAPPTPLDHTNDNQNNHQSKNQKHTPPAPNDPPNSRQTQSTTTTTPTHHTISIHASTQIGILRAYETLSQLIHYDATTESNLLPTSCTITDSPRFPHRGLLIDTSRHYLPLKQIRRIIDQLRMNKLNVLHWHITDVQSFPYEPLNRHNVTTCGAYSEFERYTLRDMAYIVQYARKNGVRVIPELDQPGHIGSLQCSHPHLFACSIDDPQVRIVKKHLPGMILALDPTNPQVYDTMTELSLELMKVFEDAYFHLGADEVQETCWWGLMDEWEVGKDVLLQWFLGNMTDRLLQSPPQPNKKVIVWDDALPSKPSPQIFTIQVWHHETDIARALDLGYQVIASPAWTGKSWYLDHLQKSWKDSYALDLVEDIGSHRRFPMELQEDEDGEEEEEERRRMGANSNGNASTNTNANSKHAVNQNNKHDYDYNNDEEDDYPYNKQQDMQYWNNLLGGEGCMWAEKVDGSNFESTVWPRMSAIAEKLWSARRHTTKWKRYGNGGGGGGSRGHVGYAHGGGHGGGHFRRRLEEEDENWQRHEEHEQEKKKKKKKKHTNRRKPPKERNQEWENIAARLGLFRCWLVRRGVHAAPMSELEEAGGNCFE